MPNWKELILGKPEPTFAQRVVEQHRATPEYLARYSAARELLLARAQQRQESGDNTVFLMETDLGWEDHRSLLYRFEADEALRSKGIAINLYGKDTFIRHTVAGGGWHDVGYTEDGVQLSLEQRVELAGQRAQVNPDSKIVYQRQLTEYDSVVLAANRFSVLRAERANPAPKAVGTSFGPHYYPPPHRG